MEKLAVKELSVDIENEVYHSLPYLSSSNIAVILDNAERLKAIKDGRLTFNGRNLDIGTILHHKILEPDSKRIYKVAEPIKNGLKAIADADYELAIIPEKFYTKSGALSKKKELVEELEELKNNNEDLFYLSLKDYEICKEYRENKDLISISLDDENLINIMVDKILAVKSNNTLKDFQHYLHHEYSFNEQSYFTEITLKNDKKVKCRVRPDLLHIPNKDKPNEIIIFDVKTTKEETSLQGWSKASKNFKYFLQEAFYTLVFENMGFKVIDFVFVVVSKSSLWSEAKYFTYGQMTKDLSKETVLKAMQKYQYCLENDIWLSNEFDYVNNEFIEDSIIDIPHFYIEG